MECQESSRAEAAELVPRSSAIDNRADFLRVQPSADQLELRPFGALVEFEWTGGLEFEVEIKS